MDIVKVREDDAPVSSELTFPASPFPRAYVHCVLDTLSDAVQAVLALRAAHHDPAAIHVMASWDLVEAVERKRQRQHPFTRACASLTRFLDEGFDNVYYHEARQGRHLLTVHTPQPEQVEQICDLLVQHHAHLVKYVDRWVVTDLRPEGTSSDRLTT